jgi:FtsP/CotA-like multicopper oxidase with cupredoxin domain
MVAGLGNVTNAITFNGTIPGPEIRVKVGDLVIVHYQSQLPASDGNTSIHWHGVELDNRSDGTAVTQDPVRPGGSYTYAFTVPRPGVFWYHPHMSPTDAVFRGQYGSLIVTGPDDLQLQSRGVLPPPADTKTLMLGDTTVCKAPGTNDNATFPAGRIGFGPSNMPPWSGDVNGDGLRDAFPGRGVGPSPRALCESPVDNEGRPSNAGPLSAGSIPNVQYNPDLCPNPSNHSLLIDLSAPCTISEGQHVLVNGSVPAPRNNPPDAFASTLSSQPPAALTATQDVLNVTPGENVRLQMINAALARYFRLQLEDGDGSILPLFRIGGEGGLLNQVRVEGGLNHDPKYLHFNGMNSAGPPQYSFGEILMAPGNRADVVLHVPSTATPGDVLTIWTRDFQRGMGSDGPNPLEHAPAGPCPAGVGNCGPNGYSLVPTVPVLHLRVQAGTSPASTLALGTPLLSATGHPVPDLRSATLSPLLTPAQAGQPVGTSNPQIEFDMGNPMWINERPMVDRTIGMLDDNLVPGRDFSQVPRPTTTRYAHLGDVLQLTVNNATGMNHPFHLHGFSFQPIRLETSPACTGTATAFETFNSPERLDTYDVPACSRLVFRVQLTDRPIWTFSTLKHIWFKSPGGGIGRWVFHCHIFEHATDGMMGELDVLPPLGPRFFGLRGRRTERRGATITTVLRKRRLLAVRVQRVSRGRLVPVGVVRLGHHRAGRSKFHWNLRVGRRLLRPGKYAITLHAISEGSLLSTPAAPGARTLIIRRNRRVLVRPHSPTRARSVNISFALAEPWSANPLYCQLLAAEAAAPSAPRSPSLN